MPAPSRANRLTSTGYSVLGLLSLGDWTAYELAQLMHRSVGLILPRAESVIYEEPKRLGRLGLVATEQIPRGARTVARYRITTEGRLRLDEWLSAPAASPQLEAETIVKILFHGPDPESSLLDHVEGLLDYARRQVEGLLDQNQGYLSDGGPFPERLAVIALTGRFVLDYHRFLLSWSQWARSQLLVGPLDEEWARSVFEEIAASRPADPDADGPAQPGNG